jgi:hypothetical protein
MSKKALNDLIVSLMGKAGSEACDRAAELGKENVRLKEIAAGSAPDSQKWKSESRVECATHA